MSRTSKLTPEQWDEIIRRNLINGESIRSLAREFDISEAAVRTYIKAHKKKIENAANQIIIATDAISDLSINSQITANKLAYMRMAMRQNSAEAAEAMSYVANKVGQAAKRKVDKLSDEDLMTEPMIKGIVAAAITVNNSLRPAHEYMAIESKEKPENDPDTKIKIIGGMNLEPIEYEHPARNRPADDI